MLGDIEDGSGLRRSQPATHKVFGLAQTTVLICVIAFVRPLGASVICRKLSKSEAVREIGAAYGRTNSGDILCKRDGWGSEVGCYGKSMHECDLDKLHF